MLFLQLGSQTREALLRILDSAIQQDDAIAGNIQFNNPDAGGLEICVQRGFSDSFLACFRIVRTDDPCICGRAFRLGRRVTAFDVSADPQFKPFLHIAKAEGFQSVQSTPVLDHDGCVVGVISTHFREPHELSIEAARVLDLLASDAAGVIASSGLFKASDYKLVSEH